MAELMPGPTCVCGGVGRPWFSLDDPSACERSWICDTCARTWSADGAQRDLLSSADSDEAPDLLRLEDSIMPLFVQSFTVQARSPRERFPIDMLRYDHCWPDSERDAVTITATQNPERIEPDEPRRVRLRRHISARKDLPTLARWQSFGWHVIVNPSDFDSPTVNPL